MDMNLNVLVPQHEDNDVRESAMGGKHQRSLSLSAKWASDKAMAIEYLRRQRVRRDLCRLFDANSTANGCWHCDCRK
jgi:hypothetical protein